MKNYSHNLERGEVHNMLLKNLEISWHFLGELGDYLAKNGILLIC